MTEYKNTFKQKEPEIEQIPEKEVESKEAKQSTHKRNAVGSNIKSVLEGSFLVRERVLKLMPFVIFLTFLGILLIFKTNIANRTVIEISQVRSEIKELRFDYINSQSKLMKLTRQSEVAKTLSGTGLKETKIPSRKIVIYK